MDFTRKTAKSMVIVAGLTAAAGISLYFIVKRSSKKKALNIANASKKPLTEQEKDDIIRQTKITYNGKFLSVDSVIAYSVSLRKIFSAEIANLTMIHRKTRRHHKNNLALYVKSCEEFVSNSTQVTRKAVKRVLDGLGISGEVISQATDYHLSQGEQRIIFLDKTLKEMEAKESDNKILSKNEFKTILLTMTELLEAERLNIPNVKRLINNPGLTGTIIWSRVYDLLYEKFGIEEEDFKKAMAAHRESLRFKEPGLMDRYSHASRNVYA